MDTSGSVIYTDHWVGYNGLTAEFVITNERNKAAMAFYRALGAERDATDEVVFDFDWA